jgi:PAS domain S-box-containing protein
MPIALPKSLQQRITNVPLRWALILPFVLPTIGAVALVGYLSYRSGQTAVEELGQQLVTATNEQVTQKLKTYLQLPPLINRLNVDTVHQGQLDLQNMPALESALFNRLQQFEQVSSVLFVSPQGQFRVVERFPTLFMGVSDPPRPNQIRIYRLDDQGNRGQLVYIDNSLNVRRDSLFYRRAIAAGKLVWNPIAQYGSLDVLTLSTSQPIYEKATKRLLGVFEVNVRLNYLSQFLRRLDISSAGQVIITDPNRALIATSTQEKNYTIKVANKYRNQLRQLKLEESQDGLTRSLGEYLRDRPTLLNTWNQSRSLEVDYKSEPHYVRITPFRDQHGLSWQIVTVIPKSHFMAAIQRNTHQTLLLCLLTLSIAIAVGLLTAHLITAHFTQLNQASRKLAAGNLNQRLLINSPVSELNSLAQTFNQMADQLQQSFDRIKTALAESEGKFTIIFRSSPDAITLVTLDEGRCVEANDSLLNLLNCTRDELIGQRFVDLEFWHDLNDRFHVRQALHQHRQIRNWEVLLCTRTKQLKTVLLSAELIEINDETYVLSIITDISDRKQAEAALQASEVRFQEIAQTLNQVSYVISLATGQYLYISPSYEKLWGYSCESLYQDPNSWLTRIHPEDLDYVSGQFNQLLFGNQMQIQYRIIDAKGEVRWIESESLVVYDEDRTPLRIVGLADDITDRKQLEEFLQISEARYRAIVEDQVELICRHQPDGTLTFVNNAYCRYFGLDPETAIGSRYEPIIFEEDRTSVAQLVKSMSLENPTVTIENRVFSQGEVRWTQWNNQALFDEQGHFIEFQSVGRDITDRKQIEEALRASEELFRRAFDDAPIGISLVSPSGQFLKANTHYCNLVGYTEAELLALTFQKITHPADLDADLKGVQQMLAGEIRSFQLEKRYITKQGTSIPVLINVAPIRDQTGKLLYFVGQTQDRRDRLKVERMKDEFISVVSHELRTPLTSIRGALGILQTDVFIDRPEKAKHMLQIAISNSERLVRLVNDILTLERLESGKVPFATEECQVTELMKQAVDSVQAIADQSAITLNLTPLSATLWAAPDAIIQTLTNLLSNAIKFSSPGDTIWLKAELGNGWTTDEADQQNSSALSAPKSAAILFSITDQGRGIPADKLGLIFEQFQQVDASDSRKKGGTGLGLAICKNIVQQHGGQIWVESTLGKGSTFHFTVPLSGNKKSAEGKR